VGLSEVPSPSAVTTDAEAGARVRFPFRIPAWISAHIPLVATATVFIYLAARISRMSHLDVETARALVASADASTVVLAAIVPAVVAAWFALLFTMTTISIDYVFIERRFTTYHAFYLVVVAGALVLVPVTWLVFGFVAAVVYIAASMNATRKRRESDPTWKPKLHREGEIGLGFALFLILVLTADVWLPAEHIRFNDGRSDLVGYWIGEDSSWATLMSESDREIVVVPLASVDSRELCRVGEDNFFHGPSLLDVLTRSSQPVYPPCFQASSTSRRER